jgi:hypothetical protein
MSFIGAMPVKKYVPGSAQGVLPVKGDFIEALWTEDGKVKGWFAAEVLLGDVSQLHARNEKRGERYMRCHRIQYTDKSPHRSPQSGRIPVRKEEGQVRS